MSQKQNIIPIASDHGGLALKKYLIETLSKEGYQFKDYGTKDDHSVDYPDFIHPVAAAINRGEFDKGVIMCGSGQGAAMTANKYPNVRAALLWDEEQTELTRRHNDANIISFPGRFINFELAAKMVKLFLNTEFEGGRHQNRIDKIPKTQI
jgi:ribose 5-phosphate isomerase B